MDRLVVWKDNPEEEIRCGVNLPIHMDGQAVGVIGITGEPEKVEPLGSVMKRITEILLREARTACLAARSDGGILFYNQVSLEFLARSIPPAIRQDLFQQVFGGCSEKEREELLETIWLYFRCDGQISRMAQTLYVHKIRAIIAFKD